MHENDRILKFSPLIRNLYNSARESLGFKPHASISIIDSSKNANNPLGKTAHYSPSERKIALYTRGRHIKDIMRSLAHELVHHNQNCRGDFETAGGTMPGYAQEDGHMREMEREAYEVGNLIFRDWEDNLKDKGGKPLFSSTAPYVPAPTSGVVGGRLLEENTMTDKLTKVQLQEIIDEEAQKLLKEAPQARLIGRFRGSPEFKKVRDELQAKNQWRPGTPAFNKRMEKEARKWAKRTNAAEDFPWLNKKTPSKSKPKTAPKSASNLGTGGQKVSPSGDTVDIDLPLTTDRPSTKRKRRKPSARIRQVQKLLSQAGYGKPLGTGGPAGDGIDGYKGKKTRAAIRAFQKDVFPNKPDEWDGIAGKKTMAMLRGKGHVTVSKPAGINVSKPKIGVPASIAREPETRIPSSIHRGGGLDVTDYDPRKAKRDVRKADKDLRGQEKKRLKQMAKNDPSWFDNYFATTRDPDIAADRLKRQFAPRKRYSKAELADRKARRDAKKEREQAIAYQAAQQKKRQWRKERGGTSEELEKNGVKDILNNIKENIMNKKLKESQLRNMIRGVIQEMFEEDLNEDNMGMPANAESQEASEEDAEAAAAAATTTASGGSTGEDYQVKEDLQSTKGHFSDNDSGAVDYENDAMEEDLGKWLEWCSKRLKKPTGTSSVQNCARKMHEKEKAKKMQEDSGEEEGRNYRRNREDDEEHLQALKKDIDWDTRHESLEESFFPKGRSTREKARKELNKGLMKRWGFTKKEK